MNILIYRTARAEVFSRLLEFLNNRYKNKNVQLWCMVQQDSHSDMKEKYPNINYLIVKEKWIKLSDIKKNKELCQEIKNIKFNMSIIPLSNKTPNNILDIKFVSNHFNIKKTYCYNVDGLIGKLDVSTNNLLFEKIASDKKFLSVITKLGKAQMKFIYLLNRISLGDKNA